MPVRHRGGVFLMTHLVKRIGLGVTAAAVALPVLAADYTAPVTGTDTAKPAAASEMKAGVKKHKKHFKKTKVESEKKSDAMTPIK